MIYGPSIFYLVPTLNKYKLDPSNPGFITWQYPYVWHFENKKESFIVQRGMTVEPDHMKKEQCKL